MTRVIIFAKAPQPGRAKTRLIPTLGAEGAANLAREMLDRTVAEALAASLAAVELCMSPPPGDLAWSGARLPASLCLSAQTDGDLGARMSDAARRGLAQGPVILIGTDCVEMDRAVLAEAATALSAADAVINPCADGGYALLGLRRYDASVFENIDWSTGAVARQTRDRIAQLGWKVSIGRVLHDVDHPSDLARWRAYKS